MGNDRSLRYLVKDALAAVVEIAVKPKRSAYSEEKTNVIQFHSRFGGVSYR